MRYFYFCRCLGIAACIVRDIKCRLTHLATLECVRSYWDEEVPDVGALPLFGLTPRIDQEEADGSQSCCNS